MPGPKLVKRNGEGKAQVKKQNKKPPLLKFAEKRTRLTKKRRERNGETEKQKGNVSTNDALDLAGEDG